MGDVWSGVFRLHGVLDDDEDRGRGRMTPALLFLLSIIVAAILVAGFTLVSGLQRRDVMNRATEEFGAPTESSRVLRPEADRMSKLRHRLEQMAKAQAINTETQSKLVQAGFDSPAAPAILSVARVASLVLIPLLAMVIIPSGSFAVFVMTMSVAAFMGFILPVAMLDRMVRLRQERIQRSIPDALDLLVVCVEAGVSLDAALLRVAKELRLPHPDLAHEFLVVNRLTNAGMPRETALKGLWQRTGVQDIRSLVSSMIQSEKWGTSIATVLRVSAETLRRKRRQMAEKKAKMAPLKMTFPLLLFILPALFTVIMGPAVVQIINEFSKVQ
jgi:tight adherence protein C